MATADRYSRAVLWLKVTLPIVALAILSTLFFVAERLDPEAAIPYADVDVEKILREQGVTKPTFGGVMTDGTTVALFAESIRPDEGHADRMTARSLVAHLDFPDGAKVTVEGETGIVDAESGEAILMDSARLQSTSGYLVRSEKIVTSMTETSVVSPGAIEADGPPGHITAGQMELTKSETPDAGYLLVFKGGVRLIYTPSSSEDP